MAEAEHSFWATLPGILTGVAALITACAAVLALFLARPSGSSGPTTATGASGGTPSVGTGSPTTATREPSDDSRAGTSPGDATNAPSGDGPDGASNIVLEPGDSLDVDKGVAGNDVAGADVRRSCCGLYLEAVRHAIVPSWTNESGCIEALRSRSDDSMLYERFGDAAVCVVTDEDAIAQIRPSLPDEDSDRMAVQFIVLG